MLVAELQEGELYIIKEGTVFRENSHEYCPGKVVTTCQIWSSWVKSFESERPTFLYLGCTYEDWSFYGVKKHHWFYMKSKKVRVDGRHVKLLEKLNEAAL